MKKAALILCALMLVFCFAGCAADTNMEGKTNDGKIGADAQIEAGQDAGGEQVKNSAKRSLGTDTGADQNNMDGQEMITGPYSGTINDTYNGTAADNRSVTSGNSSDNGVVGNSINKAVGMIRGATDSVTEDR